MEYNKKVEKLAPSGIREFFDLVIGRDDILSLGVGEPDFATPWHIREKAIYSLENGDTTYTSNYGLLELRQVISQYLQLTYNAEYNPENEILITVGVSEGMDLAMRAILNENDKVIVPMPCYVSYAPTVILAGGEVIEYHLERKDDFKLNLDKLESILKKNKIKALLLNYPSNPTGVTYNENELKGIAALSKKYDFFIISDEIYDLLTYDKKHFSILSLPDMKDRIIYFNGFSKGYAMTGFRIGYAASSKKIISLMTKIHQYTMLCAPITGQIGAIEAFKNGEKSVIRMREEYKKRRNFLVKRLNELGLDCIIPDGAFYVFPSIKNTGMSSRDFAVKLLEQEKVAVVPGTAFGPNGEGYIRISYAYSLDQIKEALQKIEHFI